MGRIFRNMYKTYKEQCEEVFKECLFNLWRASYYTSWNRSSVKLSSPDIIVWWGWRTLTSSTLILGKYLLTVPDKVGFKAKLEEENSESLNKRVCYSSTLLDRFRAKCRREYLTGLREFHNCDVKKHLTRPVKVGDFVSIYDDKVERQLWQIMSKTGN